MGFKLAQLVIEMAANTARLQTDMGKAVGIAERGAAAIKKTFGFLTGAAGGGIVSAALIGIAKRSIEAGDNLQKAAVKAGTTVKAMSELAYVAKLADVPLDALSTALKKMQIALSEAGTGSKKAQGAFDALGLTYDQLQKRKPEGQFTLIADRISKLVDPADRARAATELFGKAGADLLPLFEQGAGGIAKAVAEARKLGLVIGDDQAQALADADDSIKRLTASWEAFGTKLTAYVAPALADVLDNLSGVDTRSTNRKISDLEDLLASPLRNRTAAQRAEQEARLAKLKGLRDLEEIRRLQTGTSGGPTSRTESGYASGYAAADAAAAAQAAAEKANAEYEKQAKALNDALNAMQNETAEYYEGVLHEEYEAYEETELAKYKFAEEIAEKQKQLEEDVAKWREDQSRKSIEVVSDIFLSAYDNWLQSGKFKFDELLKYMVAQWTRSQIVQLFQNMDTSSGIGKWLSTLGSVFTGTATPRASGGPVTAGKSYLIGERRPEIYTPGASGFITPHAGGGAGKVEINYNINAPGATLEFAKALPEILRRHGEGVKADIIDGLRRGRYQLA